MSRIKDLLADLDDAYYATNPHIHFRFQIEARWPELRQALLALLPPEPFPTEQDQTPNPDDYLSAMPPQAG